MNNSYNDLKKILKDNKAGINLVEDFLNHYKIENIKNKIGPIQRHF